MGVLGHALTWNGTEEVDGLSSLPPSSLAELHYSGKTFSRGAFSLLRSVTHSSSSLSRVEQTKKKTPARVRGSRRQAVSPVGGANTAFPLRLAGNVDAACGRRTVRRGRTARKASLQPAQRSGPPHSGLTERQAPPPPHTAAGSAHSIHLTARPPLLR